LWARDAGPIVASTTELGDPGTFDQFIARHAALFQ
jgi:hypothetical protein